MDIISRLSSKDIIHEDFPWKDNGPIYENYEELTVTHIQTEVLFYDAGIVSYFEMKKLLAGRSDEQPKPTLE